MPKKKLVVTHILKIKHLGCNSIIIAPNDGKSYSCKCKKLTATCKKKSAVYTGDVEHMEIIKGLM